MNHTFKIDKINNNFYSYEYCYRDANKVKALNILDKRGNFKSPNMMNINSDIPCVIKIRANDYMVYTEYQDGADNDNVKFVIKKVESVNNFKYELKNVYKGEMSIGVYNNIKDSENLNVLNKIFKDFNLSHNIINSLSLIGVKVFYEKYNINLNKEG